MAKKTVDRPLPNYLDSTPISTGDEDGNPFEVEIECRRNAYLEDLRIAFEKDGNPLFAWDAYLICRRRNRSVPPWVFDYLDSAATRMMSQKNTLKNLADIVGIQPQMRKGKETVWTRYSRYHFRRKAVNLVKEFLLETDDVGLACRRAYKKLQEMWQDRMDPFFERKEKKAREDRIRYWYDHPDG